MEGRSFGGSYYSRPPPPPPPASRHPVQAWSYSNPGSLPPYPPPRPISGSKSPYCQGQYASPLVGLGNDVFSRMHPSMPAQIAAGRGSPYPSVQPQGTRQEPSTRALQSDWPTTPREEWNTQTAIGHTYSQAHAHVQSHSPHTIGQQTFFRNQSEYGRTDSSLQSYMSPSPSLSATFDALQIEDRRSENSPSQPSSSNQLSMSSISRSARLAQQKSYQELARMASLAAEEEENGPLYLGVGINLRDHEHRVIISFIAAGSVAAQSGLLSEGDQIRMIDHTVVDGISAQNVEEMLIGEEGSVVIITVLKLGEDTFTHATLVRKSSLREREESARRKKEIYDVGFLLSVSDQREIRIVELTPGGPAAKLGYVNIGDSIVAIDEQPIPMDIPVSDLHAFVLSRVCGPKGTSVVFSLLKAGIGMRYHVQLRRTNLFGATQLRPRNDNFLSMASTETSSAVTGSSEEVTGSMASIEAERWSQEASPLPEDMNPVPIWKAAPWRAQLDPEVLEELRRSVTECLTLVGAGGVVCYGLGIMPNQQGEPWVRNVGCGGEAGVRSGSVEAGDIIVDMGPRSLAGAAFPHVAAALKAAYLDRASLSLALYRPSARALVHATLACTHDQDRSSYLRL